MSTPKLTIEQEFKLHQLLQEIKVMNENQLKAYLVETIKLGMMKDNVFKELMKGNL